MSFSKILQIIFIVGSTFPFFIPVCLNNPWWCSLRHSRILKTEEEFLFNLAPFSSRLMVLAYCHSHHLKIEEEFLYNLAPLSSKFVVQAWYHPLIIVFEIANSFHLSGEIQESSQFFSPEPIISNYSCQLSASIHQISPVHHSIFFN